MLTPEKLQQKSRLLFNSPKKSLGKVHKGENKKKKKTIKKKPKNHCSSGARRTKKHFIEAKGKKTHSEKSVDILVSEGYPAGLYFDPPFILFLAL